MLRRGTAKPFEGRIQLAFHLVPLRGFGSVLLSSQMFLIMHVLWVRPEGSSRLRRQSIGLVGISTMPGTGGLFHCVRLGGRAVVQRVDFKGHIAVQAVLLSRAWSMVSSGNTGSI